MPAGALGAGIGGIGQGAGSAIQLALAKEMFDARRMLQQQDSGSTNPVVQGLGGVSNAPMTGAGQTDLLGMALSPLLMRILGGK